MLKHLLFLVLMGSTLTAYAMDDGNFFDYHCKPTSGNALAPIHFEVFEGSGLIVYKTTPRSSSQYSVYEKSYPHNPELGRFLTLEWATDHGKLSSNPLRILFIE